MRYNGPMHALLFDIDGTLLDAGGAGARALLAALAQVYGRPFSRNGVPFAGRTDLAIVNDLVIANGLLTEARDRSLAVFETLPAWMKIETERTPAVPCPGVPPLLNRLARRDDLLMGLVTGNQRETAAIKLASAGLDPELFPFGAYGNESADRNTLPPLALKRAAVLTGRAVTSAVVVGDTPADIACARANGLRSLAVATGAYPYPALEQAAPDHLLPDLNDLDRVLEILTVTPATRRRGFPV